MMVIKLLQMLLKNKHQAENSEKAETEAEEDNNEEPAEENTEEVATEEKDEENLADELKQLSDTISSEADNDKK